MADETVIMPARDVEPGDYRPPKIEIHEHDHYAEWAGQRTVRFFPEHFTSEVTAMFLVLSLYTFLCIILPAPLDIKADPMATPTGSKPEWYFLFLYAYLHYVPPIVGTFTPMVGVALLIFLPWLDRNPERAPSKRVIAIAGSIVLLTVIIVLTVIGARD